MYILFLWFANSDWKWSRLKKNSEMFLWIHVKCSYDNPAGNFLAQNTKKNEFSFFFENFSFAKTDNHLWSTHMQQCTRTKFEENIKYLIEKSKSQLFINMRISGRRLINRIASHCLPVFSSSIQEKLYQQFRLKLTLNYLNLVESVENRCNIETGNGMAATVDILSKCGEM